jgi:mannonate dehydratase
MRMRLAMHFGGAATDERLAYAKQLGADDVVIQRPPVAGDGFWSFKDLVLLRSRCEDAGLRLAAIGGGVPMDWIIKAMLGQPGRDEQIENYQESLRNVGRAGIPVLGFNWHPDLVWRTSRTAAERGGAKVTAFDADLVKDAPLTFDREYSEEEFWENFAYFLRAVGPVAEEAGVKMALHPSDPPVPAIGGVPRILRSFEAHKRVMELAPSPAVGLNFCVGTWAEMGGDVYEAIRHFGSQGRIHLVHFRNVKGSVPRFRESFVNSGDMDMHRAMKLFKELGYEGVFTDDHVPKLIDDTDWGHRSHAYAMGYIQALLDVVHST